MNQIVQNQESQFSCFKEMAGWCFVIGSLVITTYIFCLDLIPATFNIYCDGLTQSDKPALLNVLVKSIFIGLILGINQFIVVPWLDKFDKQRCDN